MAVRADDPRRQQRLRVGTDFAVLAVAFAVPVAIAARLYGRMGI